MWSASDEALLAGIATGDGSAARTFVRRYQQRVFGLALTILSDRHSAEDAAQDAFVRIWRHAGAFDPRRGKVAPWVLTITRNAALDAVRLRRAVPADPETMLALALPSAERSPSDHAELDFDIDRARGALAELPADQRQAVLLAAFYGLTAAEIAAIADIPLGTAKTRIRTGLRKLRTLLDTEATR
ncbi:RNA polymerase sigma factor [Aquihabitans sp. McL0605]|uniref:RNA polymerase sigma factor n=1 Tax=Aquihabitans sp. McL0605 TaxID=3415671 RepID=UPI003CF5542A